MQAGAGTLWLFALYLRPTRTDVDRGRLPVLSIAHALSQNLLKPP